MDKKVKRKGEKEPPEEPYYCMKHGLKIYSRLSFCMEPRECKNCEYRNTGNDIKGDM